MRPIQNFKNLSTNDLFETEKILKESNLVVHSSITRIVLMGSRGLLGGFRPDSDIDLGFILHLSIKNRDLLSLYGVKLQTVPDPHFHAGFEAIIYCQKQESGVNS